MHSTLEGCIRQNQKKPLPTYTLTMLLEKRECCGLSVVKRGDSVRIVTSEEEIPIYAFKMDQQLMSLLKDNMEDWYE